MAAVDYLNQGIGVTPSQGLAATTSNINAAQINLPGGGTPAPSALFDSGKAMGGQAWGIKLTGTSSGVVNLRRWADTGGQGVNNKTWARTHALVLPETLLTSGQGPITLDTFRYFDGASGRGTFFELRMEYVSAGVNRLFLYVPANNQSWYFTGSNANVTTTSKKIAYQAKGFNGTTAGTATDGTFDFALYMSPEDATPAITETISKTGQSMRGYGMEAGDLLATSASMVNVVGDGYDRYELGRTTYIPLYVANVPGVDTGNPSAVADAGAWTAPSGTILANVTDTDPLTVARSPQATGTVQWLKLAYPPINVKPSLIHQIPMVRSPSSTGEGKITVATYDGATLKHSVEFDTATDGLPSQVAVPASICATFSTNAAGDWAALQLWIGVSV